MMEQPSAIHVRRLPRCTSCRTLEEPHYWRSVGCPEAADVQRSSRLRSIHGASELLSTLAYAWTIGPCASPRPSVTLGDCYPCRMFGPRLRLRLGPLHRSTGLAPCSRARASLRNISATFWGLGNLEDNVKSLDLLHRRNA